MIARYTCLFAGSLLHILSNEIHIFNKYHLQMHIQNTPHNTLAGSNVFCYLYVIAIMLHLLCDYYNPKLFWINTVAIVLFVLPILSIISFAQYVTWFVYEPPISVVAAALIMAASCLLKKKKNTYLGI